MTLDELANEDGIKRFQNNPIERVTEMEPRELAYYFSIGDENQRIIYREFLKLQTKDYREKFDEAAADPLLGEREEDHYDDDGT